MLSFVSAAMYVKGSICQSMVGPCLLSHLRRNDSVDSCILCVLHQLMPVTTSCPHHEWDFVMAIEFSIAYVQAKLLESL